MISFEIFHKYAAINRTYIGWTTPLIHLLPTDNRLEVTYPNSRDIYRALKRTHADGKYRALNFYGFAEKRTWKSCMNCS